MPNNLAWLTEVCLSKIEVCLDNNHPYYQIYLLKTIIYIYFENWQRFSLDLTRDWIRYDTADIFIVVYL